MYHSQSTEILIEWWCSAGITETGHAMVALALANLLEAQTKSTTQYV
jgi:hypothetical protein